MNYVYEKWQTYGTNTVQHMHNPSWRSWKSNQSSADSAMDPYYTTDSSNEDCTDATNIEFMIQTFMTTLQRNLNVKEILPYLTFMSHNDARALHEIEPRPLAVEKLLEIIMHETPHEKGKWGTFLMALEKTCYKYLHQLLTGKTETNHFYTNEILKIMKPGLINDMLATDVIDLLIERGLINEEDQCQIESAEKNRGRLEANRVLFDKGLPNWHTEFAEVQENVAMSEIAKVFKMVEHHTHFEKKDGDYSEKKHNMRKRKFKKEEKRKCNKVIGSATSGTNELKIKRKKTSVEIPTEYPTSIDMDTKNVSTTGMKVEELKQNMTELKADSHSVESIVAMQKELTSKMDALMNILTEHLTKTVEEQTLFKEQLEEQNHCLKYLAKHFQIW